MKYKIPNIEIYNTFMYTGLVSVGIKYLTGFAILSNFLSIFFIFIPILYILSYIIFFTKFECERYDVIYKEMREDMTNTDDDKET